jgi:predicted unusual protein kinase regulating ubiquinone biosynthesis (AarF/ABC1/UbiB family)
VDGIKITEVDRLRDAGVDPARVVQLLVEAYCEQVLVSGFFHADPHPGNLFVQPEGPRLVLLDFGLAKQLPTGFRQGVVAFTLALLREDPEGMAQSLLALGFETRDGSSESLTAIARVLLAAGRSVRAKPYLARETVEQLREELPALIRENPIVRIPTHVVLLGRVLGLLSGVGRTLGQKVDLVRTIFPYALGTHEAAVAGR